MTPQAVAYWYFRLNGCLQVENFVIHPDQNCDPSLNQARAHGDLIGIRMPWRNEMGMLDDTTLCDNQNKILIYFAEIRKGGRCKLNSRWSNPEDENLPRALSAIGCVPEDRVGKAAEHLYTDCFYEDELVVIRLMAIGEKINEVYQNSKPKVVQITWYQALRFIHDRFNKLRVSKSDHEHWPESGRLLWEWSQTPNADNFEKRVLRSF